MGKLLITQKLKDMLNTANHSWGIDREKLWLLRPEVVLVFLREHHPEATVEDGKKVSKIFDIKVCQNWEGRSYLIAIGKRIRMKGDVSRSGYDFVINTDDAYITMKAWEEING